MPVDLREEVELVDSQGRKFGRVGIDRIEGDRLFATFSALPEFAAVRPLFERLEQAANDQVFAIVDQLSDDIDRLGLRLVSPDGADQLQLNDVQIMNETDLCCRVPNLALIQNPPLVATIG
ncbi:MAG: hypothetical protein KY476_12840 [Planctomycetes bacterium]|nr:hypothetical protein [Planctomycetota bacterium]